MDKYFYKDESIEAILTPLEGSSDSPIFGEEAVSTVRAFHRKIKGYKATPLVNLAGMANRIKVDSIHVKDESYRFGLGSFKVVGGLYGLYRVVLEKLGIEDATGGFDDLKQPKFREQLDRINILSATDGNHGRGLAWAGQQLGLNVTIYMPKGTASNRVMAIEKLGATVHVTDKNYDETLDIVIARAEEDESQLLVQDQAWPGYEKIPNWISQGYITMADEALTQLAYSGSDIPTHVFLQAGAGTMAFGVAGYLSDTLGKNCPKIFLMEAKNANCYFQSIIAGKAVQVEGDLETIMAGLSVGEVNSEAYRKMPPILSGYLSCDDTMSRYGTRLLAAPQDSDTKVVSGESGSVGMGVLNHIMLSENAVELKERLGLDDKSRILLFSTEGDTDPVLYEQILFGFDK